MLLLVLLLLPNLSLSTLPSHGPHGSHDGVTTSASPTSSFEGIEDPSTQCIDIPCYKPIEWSNDKEEVCRFKKEKTCKEKRETVLNNILMTDFETLPLVHGADLRRCDGN